MSTSSHEVAGGGQMEMVLLFNFERNVFMFIYCLTISWSDVQRHRVADIERHLHKININFEFEVLSAIFKYLMFELLCVARHKAKVMGKCFFFNETLSLDMVWLFWNFVSFWGSQSGRKHRKGLLLTSTFKPKRSNECWWIFSPSHNFSVIKRSKRSQEESISRVERILNSDLVLVVDTPEDSLNS